MTEQTALTDAERLAAAEAAMAAAMEEAKAARLPSATAALALLTSDVACAFLDALRVAVDASIDDLPRAAGTQGAEGTKQMLQRVITSIQIGLDAAQQRVAVLQPAEAPELLPSDPEAAA